jgi:hypothetical protein
MRNSFDPQMMKLLGCVMSEIEAGFDMIDDNMRETIAARIITLASEGESDPDKLRDYALSALEGFTSRERKAAGG